MFPHRPTLLTVISLSCLLIMDNHPSYSVFKVVELIAVPISGENLWFGATAHTVFLKCATTFPVCHFLVLGLYYQSWTM